jgi:phenylalanyl-tRNA synthetase beta chain
VKVSFNWLKDYINKSDISVDEVVEKLTSSGLEVEEVVDQAKVFRNFVIGYVAEHSKHPNAEKLSLCKVNDGENDFNVVCGAPNVSKGQKVVFAKIGAVVPTSNMEIKKAKIRGQESFGMLCSERELGLSENHDGIMVLGEDAPVGKTFAEYIGLDDYILDINITPNRADAFSHIGVCRDLAALFQADLILPEIKQKEKNIKAIDEAAVEIINNDACPRYVAKIVKGVTIKESPNWLKKKLKNIGLRPINNVVDVTNFVLHEIGQPLHAFDLDKLAGNKIIVRYAKDDEKFVTLDSKERILTSTDLMICDAEKPVALAGVMGGENSEVTEATKNILIESAYFNPSVIRKTSKKLGLSTDASTRFERGCDPEIVIWAARRAADFIQQLGGGEILGGEIDIYPNKILKKIINLRNSRIGKIMGVTVPAETSKNILSNLGFTVKQSDGDNFTVEVPTFRPDIEREIDLVEEVARIYGFDKVPLIEKINVTLDEKIDQTAFNDNLRNRLVALGLNEIISNSLLSKEIAEKFGNSVSVLNPQSAEMSNTRPSLLPGMLITISKNLKVREKDLALYEIGHTFIKNSDEIRNFDDITEHEHLLIAMTGLANSSEWYQKERAVDFYDIKGTVKNIIEFISPKRGLISKNISAGVGNIEYGEEIFSDSDKIILYGKLKNETAKIFDISQNVFIADFDLTLIKELKRREKSFTELLKFPKVSRDFAFVFDKNISSKEIIDSIKDNCSELLKNVKLFDIFESESIGKNNISMAFGLEFYSSDRTLTEEEVDKEFWNVIEKIKNKFNAKLRGS